MPEIVQISLIILISLLMLFLIFVFYKLIIREKEIEKEDFLLSKGSSIDHVAFKRFINRRIKSNKGKNFFTLIGVTLTNYDQIEESYGFNDASKIYNDIQANVKSIVGTLAVIGNAVELNTFYIFLPKVYTNNEINQILINIKKMTNIKTKIFGDIHVNLESNLSYLTYPVSGNNVEDLLTNLKLALYLANRTGGNTINAYTKDMDKDKEFIDFYYELKNAINNKEFSLYYQPIVDIEKNNLMGFETFIRWIHPKKGVLKPNEFIKMLENSGDINWIGIWSIEEIFKTQLEIFNKHKLEFKYHVNFSHVQFLNSNLISDLQKVIEKYRFNPEMLTIEIIDFEKMINHDEALRMLLRILNNNIKVAVSINDVNYQLLSDIERHRINVIKLSNNVITSKNVTDANFINSIKELVNKKNVEVVVESIETESDREKSLELGFKYNQGFFYSKPLEKDKIDEYIENK